MFVDPKVRDAELAFLNAPFREGGWQVALDLLAGATKTTVTQLCGGGEGSDLAFNYFSQDLHDPHAHLINPLLYGSENWRFNCRIGGAGSIQFETHYEEYRSGAKTDFYDDAVSDLDLPYGCQSPLILDSEGLIGLALLRSRRDGPCTPDVISGFTRIARQAQRAVRVELALGQERAENMLAGLAKSGENTLLLDRQGRIVAMTDIAEALFDCPIGLRLEGLRVRLSDSTENRHFDAALGRLLASDGLDGPILHEARVGRCASQPEGYWRLFLTRLPTERDVIGVGAQFALTLRPVVPA